MAALAVTCPALGSDRRIPLRHAHRSVSGGANVSLPVSWSAPPAGTRSLLVTIIDHHPIARLWVHWCVGGIPPGIVGLSEGASQNPGLLPAGAIETLNGYGQPGYGGPAPPAGSGPHEYVISVYALSGGVPAFRRASPGKKEIDDTVEGMVLAAGSCSGVFERG